MINFFILEVFCLYCVYIIVWQGIEIEVWYMCGWVGGMDYIEVCS